MHQPDSLVLVPVLTPIQAFIVVMGSKQKFLTNIFDYPVLRRYLTTWDMDHPYPSKDILIQLYDLSPRFLSLANYCLNNGIGGSDSRGLVMRIHFGRLIEAIGRASNGLRTEAESLPSNEYKDVFFKTNWQSIAHRLVDEHKLRDTNEGDEFS